MAQDPYRYYRLEAREILDALGQGALELERGAAGPERVTDLLRLAHTLKGASRVVKQEEIAALAHEVEERLAPPGGARAAPEERAREILRVARAMEALLAGLSPEGRPAPDESEPAQEAIEAIRVDVEDADAVLRAVSTQGAHLEALRREVSRLEGARQLAASLADELSPGRGGAPEGRARATAAGLCREVAGGVREASAALDRASRDHAEALAAAERLRLAPTRALFTSLERAARDAAAALGKLVEFRATGGDDRLDVGVLSPLRKALLHVVRNAVAHGIEAPAERAAAGKGEIGRIELAVERSGGTVVLTARDDGRGIDFDAVRRAAVQRGVLDEAAAAKLDAEGLARLLLRGGISTSAAVSQVSGRGIGLDVVRETMAQLHGEVSLSSARGHGTTVVLAVPPGLASTAVLVLEDAGARATVPLESVRRAFRLAPRDAIRDGAGEVVLDGTGAIPFLRLSDALGRASTSRGERPCSAVIVADGAGRVAVGADRLLGVETVLVRPLPALAPRSPLVSGIAVEVAGRPELVLDPEGLAAAVRGAAPAMGEGAPPRRPAVLVIEDSLTTRMLEQSILESAGYEVDVACSAEEAWTKVGDRRYGLFVVDVELPGADGYHFLARSRADPGLQGIPSILVTSRSSPEDRQRGEELGARAYIVKSEFDQVALLRTVRELVG